MKPSLQLRVHQQLSLTPQLQQAIRLLQLSQLELVTELRQLTEANPLLEFAEDGEDLGEDLEDAAPEAGSAEAQPDFAAAPAFEGGSLDFSQPRARTEVADADDFEPQDAAPESLRDHLSWQINLSPLTPRQQAIAQVLVDALDDNGYLRDSLAALVASLAPDIEASVEEVDAVRRQLQRLDPTGVASLDLRDCLGAQLDQLAADTPQLELARRIVDSELELLAHQDLARLARRLRAPVEAVADAAALIRSLDPHPGAALDPTPVEYVAPDAYAWRNDSGWHVTLSPAAQPRMGLNQHYCGLIARARRDDAAYLRGQLQEARWLLKSLQSRADTLLKVAQTIVRRQRAYLDYGAEAMRPLVLREIAEEVGMHESTISRVTTRKYLHTPRGTFEFKYFFSSSVATEDGGSASATAIQAVLRKLVAAEDPRRPLSDQALTEQFNRRGIQVARRTIAKYREVLRIPSSSERQRAG
jgi:RNA polymerase sigma-54 factor